MSDQVTMQISHVLRKEFQPERFDTLVVFAFWIFAVAARGVFGAQAASRAAANTNGASLIRQS